ncbi:MAG TPA: phosphatidylinositol-specific phospholipase C domain-containing protein [Fluviicola sp.]|nr:phosphatidylinositol-specific phospholipase C domain-containing protein [Fluviicola sp.]
MGTLRIRNCTIWDVHYWRQTAGNDKDIAKPGTEGTLSFGVTYTLGVKRLHVSPDGKDYRSAVNPNGIYYAVWDNVSQKLQILTEEQANNYPITSDNKYLTNWIQKFPSWMSHLKGTYTLDRYTIPGTHDSGTKNTGDGAAHTQNFGIYDQLQDGIRFLDIRLDGVTAFDNELVVKHGCILCFLNFSDVLNDCKTFLASNNRETIIMLVNASGCLFNDIASRFENYLAQDAYKNLFYLGDTLPTLDQVRGKVVLFRRFEADTSDSPLGIDLSSGWLDNATFTLITPQEQHFQIEDQYAEHDTHVKARVVDDALGVALDNQGNGTMYITYNSISSTLFHTPYMYAWGGSGIDPALNPHLESFLAVRPGARHFGTVMLDFYNNQGSQNQLVEMLIAANEDLLEKE